MSTDEMGLTYITSGASNFHEDFNDNFDIVDKGYREVLTLASNFTEGEWAYVDGSGEAELAQADAEATSFVVGVCTETGLAASERYFVSHGVHTKAGWGLTAGDIYYLSNATPGAMTNVRPVTGTIVELGIARSATKFAVRIKVYLTEVTGGDHSVLSNLAWSAASHTMDTTLDMVENDISNIAKAYVNHLGENDAAHGIVFDNDAQFDGAINFGDFADSNNNLMEISTASGFASGIQCEELNGYGAIFKYNGSDNKLGIYKLNVDVETPGILIDRATTAGTRAYIYGILTLYTGLGVAMSQYGTGAGFPYYRIYDNTGVTYPIELHSNAASFFDTGSDVEIRSGVLKANHWAEYTASHNVVCDDIFQAPEIWVFDSGANPAILIGDSGGAGDYGKLGWNSAGDYLTLGTQTGGLETVKIDESANMTLANGDLLFSGDGSGLPFAEIYYMDSGFNTALAAQDTYYQIVGFDTNGESNNATPDHTNDHITIDTAGRYRIAFSLSCRSALANTYWFLVRINNGGTDFTNIMVHRTTSNANRLATGCCVGYADLANGDTVELWVQRTDGGAVSKTITIEHVTLNVELAGGT
jgi:hypothetical protein